MEIRVRYSRASNQDNTMGYRGSDAHNTSSPSPGLPCVEFKTRDGNDAYAELYSDGVWLAFWS